MSSYAYLIAPPGAGSTLQGIFGASFEGIGTVFQNFMKVKFLDKFMCLLGIAVGSLLGGFIFQKYGGATMYRSFGIYTIVFGIVYSSVHFFIDRNNKRTRKGNFHTHLTSSIIAILSSNHHLCYIT